MAKDKAMPSWPLLGFNAFLALMRRATRVCRASDRPAAVATAAALCELVDIAVRTERNYRRMGTMGPNDVRFKAHMYLHLQYACIHRMVFVRARVLAAFELATDPFVARLPASAVKTSRTFGKSQSSTSARQQTTTSTTFCYLCGSTSHLCNDEGVHPKENGEYAKLSQQEKDKVLECIQQTDVPSTTKTSFTKKVKDFWSRHSL